MPLLHTPLASSATPRTPPAPPLTPAHAASQPQRQRHRNATARVGLPLKPPHSMRRSPTPPLPALPHTVYDLCRRAARRGPAAPPHVRPAIATPRGALPACALPWLLSHNRCDVVQQQRRPTSGASPSRIPAAASQRRPRLPPTSAGRHKASSAFTQRDACSRHGMIDGSRYLAISSAAASNVVLNSAILSMFRSTIACSSEFCTHASSSYKQV